VISFAPAGLGRFDERSPSDESLGYCRSSLTGLWEALVGEVISTVAVFKGERFDVMSVRRWRERVLGGKASG
jgi:hypothetical protein